MAGSGGAESCVAATGSEKGELEAAVDWLRGDGVIAYPTETVWGLGALADQPRAIERLMDWKGRKENAPLAVLVSSPAAATVLGCEVRPAVLRLMEAFWPGPLMIVVPCRTEFAPGVARFDGALGLRCSSHPVATRLVQALEAAGLGPLTSTSLNRSGQPAVRNLTEVSGLVTSREIQELSRNSPTAADADPGCPLLVASPECDAGGASPSTVVDCTQAQPQVLREGEIDRASIERVLAE